MSTRKTRNRAKEINYVEIDSDIDLSDGEKKQVERGGKRRVNDDKGSDGEDEYSTVRDTTESTERSKKKPRKSRESSKSKQKVKYDYKILLDLPFDLFAEVCNHLEVADLINLGKVNKSLHTILVSRASRPIWAGIRKRDGFALFEGMTELEFAVFSTGNCCQGCGSHRYIERLVHLRSTFCKKCRSEKVIDFKSLRREWPDLHSRAIECVRFERRFEHHVRGDEVDPSAGGRFLVCDLARVNSDLLDLEEEDAIAQMALETTNRKTSSRSRPSVETEHSGEEAVETAVSEYVSTKAEWVLQQRLASKRFEEAVKNLNRRKSQEANERWTKEVERRREKFDEYSPLLRNMDWSQDDIDIFRQELSWRGGHLLKCSPSTDPDPWAQCLSDMRGGFWARYQLENKLRDSLKVFYESLKITESPHHGGIFPTKYDFDHFESVKAYWKDPASREMTKSRWLKLLPNLLPNLDKYCEALRVEAIRSILAAQQRTLISTFSLSPSKYPRSAYPDSFFDLAISHFPSCWTRKYAPRPLPYPAAAFDSDGNCRGKGTFKQLAESRTTLTIQAMLDAAGLDSSTTTAAELDAVGRRFTWDNDPEESERDALRDWKELIYYVRRRGPNKTRYREGTATTIVSYFPQVDVDGSTYVDEEGNGLGELIDRDEGDSTEDEEEEEEGSTRRRRRHEEEKDDEDKDAEQEEEE